jgi:hypothetical protein
MSEPEKKTSGVKIVIAAMTCLFVGLVVIPDFIRARRTNHANYCINNLQQIDAAKQEWALANGKTNGVVTVNQITNYLYHGILPKCPSGGTYTIGNLAESPICSLGTTVTPPHVLP